MQRCCRKMSINSARSIVTRKIIDHHDLRLITQNHILLIRTGTTVCLTHTYKIHKKKTADCDSSPSKRQNKTKLNEFSLKREMKQTNKQLKHKH